MRSTGSTYVQHQQAERDAWGLILLHNNGAIYCNQTYGVRCQHDCERGFLVEGWEHRYRGLISRIDDMILTHMNDSYWKGLGLSLECAEAINDIFRKSAARYLSISWMDISDSHEAWIYCNFHPDNVNLQSEADFLKFPLSECSRAVLSYANSD